MQNKYTYTITPRAAALGGGWRLRLLVNGEEVGGGVFPLDEYRDQGEPLQYARTEAEIEAEAWITSRDCTI